MEGQQKLDVFDEMVFHRKRQARASVVVEVSNPAKSAATVKQACSIHGEVKNLFHYSHNKKVFLILSHNTFDINFNNVVD